MDSRDRELLMKDEVYGIVGAAFEVSNQLGCGFLEAIYQEALEMEFAERGIPFESKTTIRISYKGRILKNQYIADLLCHDQIIVEVKAIKAITGLEEAQLLNYLRATRLPVGLILNFGASHLEWKRYANTRGMPV